MFNVLRSQDSGANWSMAMPTNPGNQGWYNNCIDVSPADSKLVAIGWRSGPFLSKDGAQSWTQVSGPGLHSDLHVVYFPGIKKDPNALFVGSDGGVALISGAGAVNIEYNKHLLNLQLYRGDGMASPHFNNLYASGTQDNGNVSCMTDPTLAPTSQPWIELEGGNGGVCCFLNTGQLVRYDSSITWNWQQGTYCNLGSQHTVIWWGVRNRYSFGRYLRWTAVSGDGGCGFSFVQTRK